MGDIDKFDTSLFGMEETIRENAKSGKYLTMGKDNVRHFGIYRRRIQSAYYSTGAQQKIDEASQITDLFWSRHRTMSELGSSAPPGFKTFNSDLVDPMRRLASDVADFAKKVHRY